jgi:uncharacterized protein YfkK (UPF0435 family)
MADNLKEIKARIKAINEQIVASDRVSKKMIEELKTLRALSKEARNLSAWESKRLGKLNEIGKFDKAAVMQMQAKSKVGQNLSKYLNEQVSLNNQAVKGELDILDIAKQQNKLFSMKGHLSMAENKLGTSKAKLTKEEIAAAREHVANMEEGLSQAVKTNELAKTRNKRAQLYSTEVGEFVQKYDDFKDKVKGVLSSLTLKNVLLAGALGIVVALGKLFFGMIKSSFAMQKELGVGAGHAMGLNVATREAAAGGFLYGESLEDVAGRASTLVDEWGIVNQETKNAVQVATDLERNYGITATSAAAVAQMMEATSSSTKDVLLSGMTDQMKELQAQGIPVGKVMEDVASDTDFFAKFMKKGGKNVIKAAAFAKKLGMSMSTISGSANALLDWEESINAEMEASVLLGREVNMERARELAFAGDLEGMQKEIMRQVGSEADFNRMNVVQREALAAAAGLSLTDLTKMVSAEEKLTKMTGKERKEHEKAQKITSNMQKLWNGLVGIFRYMYKKLITPIANAFMRMLGINVDLASGAGNFEGVLAKVKGWADLIVTRFEAWLKGGGLEKIKNFFVMIWNTAKMIGGVLLSIGAYLGEHKGLLTVIVGLWAANKLGLLTMLGGLGKWVAGLGKVAKAQKSMKGGGGKGGGMSSMMGKMKPSAIIKGAAAMVIMAAATWVMAKAMQQFSTGVSWKGVAMGIVSLLALVAAALVLGALMMSGVGAVALIAGAAALVILAGAMWVMGKAMQEFSKAAVILIPVIEVLFEGIALVINTIAGAFVTMLDAIVISFRSFAAMGREGGLLSAAAGMTAISVALGLFGGGSLLTGIGSAIGDFFGGDPIDKFQRFGALGPGLDQTATAMANLKTNMQAFQSLGIRDMASATQALAKSLTALAKASHKVNKAQRAALRTQAMKGIGQWLGLIDEDVPNASKGGGSGKAEAAGLVSAVKDVNATLIQIRSDASRHSQDNVSAVEGASVQR